MSRACRHAEISFSPSYDGTLAPEDKARFDAHLASCDACRESFASYQRSMSDLAKLRPSGNVDDAFVAQLMARVERAGTESGVGRISGVHGGATARSRFPAFASHIVAALVGAAATVAIVSLPLPFLKPDAPMRTESPVASLPQDSIGSIGPISYIARALPVRFEGAERSFERNDRVESVAESFSIRPGETLRSLPSQRVSISLAETGELMIHVENAGLQAPPPTIHEIKFVEMPSLVTVDRELVDDAVDEIERRMAPRLGELDFSRSMASMLDSISRFDRALRDTKSRSEVAEPVAPVAKDVTVNDAPDFSPTIGAFEPVTFTAGTTPTTIRRTPDLTTLSIQGTLVRTIPELIALLHDDDDEVADLAHARLVAIREELETDPRYFGKLSTFPAATEPLPPTSDRLFGLLRNPFLAPQPTERELSAAERWSRWWRDNALVVATGQRTLDR